MVRILLFWMLVFSALSLSAQEDAKYIGSWQGTLDVGAVKLRIAINVITRDGKIVSTMDSPDQNAFGIPADITKMNGPDFQVEVKVVKGSFSGALQHDTLLVGKWKQNEMEFPLSLVKRGAPFKLVRPQEPQAPFPYQTETWRFENKKQKIALEGTLTIPEGQGPFPAVVMVTGSGPQDRDENIFGHRPFAVIADYLARNGIASFRYDDRGIGKSAGMFKGSTTFDFADDAESALLSIIDHPKISKNIGILGHSEGGLIAPMVAARNPKVKFIVLLAGPGVTGKEILLSQMEMIAKVSGIKDEEIKKSMEVNRKIYDMVIDSKDTIGLELKVRKLMSSLLKKDKAADYELPIEQEIQISQQAKKICDPWFYTFLKYDPRSALSRVKCPVLALNGTKDIQVSSSQNLPEIENILKSKRNRNFKCVQVEGVNHLFQHAQTGSVKEYGEIEETFAPEALKIIGDWIKTIK